MKQYTDDIILVQGLINGEDAAYLQLFDTYFQKLSNYAFRLLGDTESANDTVQDVICHLFESRTTLSPTLSLLPFLYRSVYNSCISQLRHSSVVQDFIDEEMADFYINEILLTPEAETALQRQELRAAIDEAVGQLPPRCREVFLLSKVEGLSNPEIAERLDISRRTVEVHMSKALAQLRESLRWLLVLIAIV